MPCFLQSREFCGLLTTERRLRKLYGTSRLSGQSSRKRHGESLEQVRRSVPDLDRQRRSTEASGHRQQPCSPVRQYGERQQVESPPGRRLKIGAAAQVALGSPLSEGQVAGPPLARPLGSAGRTTQSRGASWPSAPHAHGEHVHPPAARPFEAAQGFTSPESHLLSYPEPLLSPRLQGPPDLRQAIGVQGMDALQTLPAPALDALITIVNQSPALEYAPLTNCMSACMSAHLPAYLLAMIRPPKLPTQVSKPVTQHL